MRLNDIIKTCLIFFLTSSISLAKTHNHHKKIAHHSHAKTLHHTKSPRKQYQPIANDVPISQDSSTLANTLNAIVRTASSRGDIGILVRSMKTGNLLYAYNPNQSFVPGSSIKILTAEAALFYLGSDYQFTTAIYTDAINPNDSILNGNIYVRFSGDPTLEYHDILKLVGELKNHYQTIRGNVYVDNSTFDQNFTARGWNPDDLGYCFSAPIGSSIINQNCIGIKITSGKSSNSLARVYPSEQYFYPPIRNEVTTRTGSGCHLNLSTEQNGTLNLGGCMPRGRYAWNITYVIPNPNAYSFTLIKQALKETGIHIQGSILNGTTPAGAKAIAAHRSEPLNTIIHHMLKKSNNIFASALYKKLGNLYTHRSGSWDNGALAVENILRDHANFNSRGLRMIDGSGLSHHNLVTPEQMMQVLDAAYHSANIRDDFMNALPIAGVDGTLKHRLYTAARKVRAKTGTVNGVASLAGFATTRGQDTLAFVIMMNGRKGMHRQFRPYEDKIVTALTQYNG